MGILITNFYLKNVISSRNNLFIDSYDINNILLISYGELFVYVLIKRIKQFIVIVGLSELFNPVLILVVIALVFGNIFGMLLSFEVMRLGIKGVILASLCFFPQYIIYIFTYALIVINKSNIQDSKNTITRKLKNKYSEYCKSKVKYFLIVIVLVVIGSFLEAIINPKILNFFYQYIV